MLFTSLEFVILTFLTVLAYYSQRTQARQVSILILSSLVFYAWTHPYLVFLILFSGSVTSLASYFVRESNSSLERRCFSTIGVAVNLSVLAFFKYSGLLWQTFGMPVDGSIGNFIVALPLPVGISFYTFQGVSMMVDSFRHQDDPASNKGNTEPISVHYSKTLFFIVFFPQLVAGPILKAKMFMPQISHKSWKQIDVNGASRNLILGYFLKMVVANNLHNQTFWIAYPYYVNMSAKRAWSLLIAYSIQIFADFAGYSLIAIGVAALFGCRLPQNFNFPYLADSFSNFWQRWHMSLSSWLKDYLYIPLGEVAEGAFGHI